MYILYIDESGDPGQNPHGSPFFILSGLIVPEAEWLECLNRMKSFRLHLKNRYGLLVREEIHATELIRIKKIEGYRLISKTDRIGILKEFAREFTTLFEHCKIINVCLKKSDFLQGEGVQIAAWKRMIQRYDTYLRKSGDHHGIIISDDTDGPKVIRLLRKMRIVNYVTSQYGGYRNIPTDRIVEDIFERSSTQSYFIQSVDLVTQLLYRKEVPKGSLKKYGIQHLFSHLEPLLLVEAATQDPLGIVRR